MSLLYDDCLKRGGTDGFVYRAQRPFHPQRFCRALTTEWPGVSRFKGFIWPECDWPASLAARSEIRRGWHPAYGDRRQEVVFIGAEISRAAITRDLDGLLLTDEEMARGEATGWACFADETEQMEPRRPRP